MNPSTLHDRITTLTAQYRAAKQRAETYRYDRNLTEQYEAATVAAGRIAETLSTYTTYQRLTTQYAAAVRNHSHALRSGVCVSAMREGMKIIAEELKPFQEAVLRMEANQGGTISAPNN